MKETTKKTSKAKKIVGIILGALLAIIFILCIIVGCIWHNEIRSIASIKAITPQDLSHDDGYTYQMTVYGDYYMEDFLAQGGVSSDSELISFLSNHITRGLMNIGIETTDISCSSITATTADGDRIFGRNYDFAQTNNCIVYTAPSDGRHASVSTIDLQFISIENEVGIDGIMDYVMTLAAPYVPLDGMNDAGVSCGIYMTYQGEPTIATDQQTDKPDITSTTLLRLILDYADSVDEAVEIAMQYDLHDSAGTSYHYMVADATGKSAILEWVGNTDVTDNDGGARTLNVIYNTNDTAMGTDAYQVVTNFIVTPDYYASDDEKAGFDRYEYLRTNLENLDGIVADEEEAMNLLAGVGRRSWNNDDSNGITVHSVVYNLTDKTAVWVGNEHYGEEDYTFYLDLN